MMTFLTNEIQDRVVIDGLSFDIIEDPSVLPPTWAVFASVLEEPEEGGRLLRVGYRGEVIAYAIADANSARWCDIELTSGPGVGRPLGAVAFEPGSPAAAFWERVTRAVDIACDILFAQTADELPGPRGR